MDDQEWQVRDLSRKGSRRARSLSWARRHWRHYGGFTITVALAFLAVLAAFKYLI